MFKHVTWCLVSAVIGVVFIAMPLREMIHTGTAGQKLAIKSIPDVHPRYSLYKKEWWRDRETIRKIRAQYTDLTDQEFLREHTLHGDIYLRVAAALNISTTAMPDDSCAELAGHGLPKTPAGMADNSEDSESILK